MCRRTRREVSKAAESADGHGYSSSLSTKLNKSTDNCVTEALTQNRRIKMTDLFDQIDEESIKY